MNKRLICLSSILMFIFCFIFSTPSHASIVSLDVLAEKAKYKTEQQIIGYRDVEKTGYREVEKIGYQDVEVPVYQWVKSEDNNNLQLAEDWSYEETEDRYYIYPNNNYSGGYFLNKSENKLYKKTIILPGTETKEIIKNVPYTVKETVYKDVTKYYTKNNVTALTKSNSKSKLKTRDKKGKIVEVKIPKNTSLIKVNSLWYKAKINYSYYEKRTEYYAKQKINTNYVYYNSKGKKVNVIIPKDAKLTYKNGKYYATVVYTPYKKSGKKWVKQKPVSKTVNVNKKHIKSKLINKNTKKSTTVYVQAKDVVSKKTKVKSGTKNVTKYKKVKEYVQVPIKREITAWDVYQQVDIKIEKEPYTYIETEPYTYIEQEPIYETIKIENSQQEKYQNVINFYRNYWLTEEELYQLLDKTGVEYSVVEGYDLTRFVTGVITINGVSRAYRFDPNTRVKLMIFEDHTAINLSYLLTAQTKYEDVKISANGYKLN